MMERSGLLQRIGENMDKILTLA
nr:VP4 [hepatovirus B1]